MFGYLGDDGADDFGVVVHEVDACLVGFSGLSCDDDDEFAALHLAVVACARDFSVELDGGSGLHHVEGFAFRQIRENVDEDNIVCVVFEDVERCLTANSSSTDNRYHNNQGTMRLVD